MDGGEAELRGEEEEEAGIPALPTAPRRVAQAEAHVHTVSESALYSRPPSTIATGKVGNPSERTGSDKLLSQEAREASRGRSSPALDTVSWMLLFPSLTSTTPAQANNRQ